MAKANSESKAKERRNQKDIRRKIYDCALALFVRDGFSNVKVSDICAAADVSVGTFYYYFPSKESVFEGYADSSDFYMTERAPDIQADTAAELLKKLIMLKIECIVVIGPENCSIGWMAELKQNHDVTMDMSRAAYGMFMNAIEKGMRSGEFRSDLNLYMATSLLRYIMAGVILRWAIQGNEIDLRAEAEQCANSFIDLLTSNNKNN